MKISIEKTGEGFQVEVEQEMDPASGALEAEQEMGQTFASLDEAMNYVREQFGTGEMEAEKPMMEGEDAFVSGFKQARGLDQGY